MNEKLREPALHRLVMEEMTLEMRTRILRIWQPESVGTDDAPAMHGEARDFRVELDAIGIAIIAEGLVLEGVAGGQPHSARGQGEPFPVPVIDVLRPGPRLCPSSVGDSG